MSVKFQRSFKVMIGASFLLCAQIILQHLFSGWLAFLG